MVLVLYTGHGHGADFICPSILLSELFSNVAGLRGRQRSLAWFRHRCSGAAVLALSLKLIHPFNRMNDFLTFAQPERDPFGEGLSGHANRRSAIGPVASLAKGHFNGPAESIGVICPRATRISSSPVVGEEFWALRRCECPLGPAGVSIIFSIVLRMRRAAREQAGLFIVMCVCGDLLFFSHGNCDWEMLSGYAHNGIPLSQLP